MKIKRIIQLKPIQKEDGHFVYPLCCNTSIIVDRSRAKIKQHQLIYQQGNQYGTVGDCCDYLTDSEIISLEQKGMVKIIYKTK